jgi:hypothetical protein
MEQLRAYLVYESIQGIVNNLSEFRNQFQGIVNSTAEYINQFKAF